MAGIFDRFPKGKGQIAIQSIGAIIILIILYILTLVVLNIDSLVINNNIQVLPKQQTQIISGYAPVSYLTGQAFNTINPLVDNFKKIGKSINTSGGSQYSYQFWIKIDDTSNESLFNDLILLLKGDNKKYSMSTYDKSNNQLISTYKPDYLISSPLIKFGASYREIEVYFNTSKGPLPISSSTVSSTNSLLPNITINMNPAGDTSSRRNVLSLLPLNWYLFSFVFQDNYDLMNGSENGIKFTFYVNDFPYQINSASTDNFLSNNMLKQNDGDLFILPNFKDTSGNGTGGQFMRMGNVNYYNYALEDKDVAKTYKAGPPNYSAVQANRSSKSPTYLSAYNKIDVYNY